MHADDDGQWAVVAVAAQALAGTLERLHLCFFANVCEEVGKRADAVLQQVQPTLAANLCRIVHSGGPVHQQGSAMHGPQADAAAAALQCMANITLCVDHGAAAPLDTHFPINRAASRGGFKPPDRSTLACLPKRTLAQKLVELPAACKAVVDALGGGGASRDASLAVLLNCCALNMQLAIQCNKQGLPGKLLKLSQSPGLPELSKVRS